MGYRIRPRALRNGYADGSMPHHGRGRNVAGGGSAGLLVDRVALSQRQYFFISMRSRSLILFLIVM